MVGLGISLGLTRGKGGGVSYEAEAAALFARFTTPATDTRKGLINDLIKALKAAGVWANLDAFYVLAAADSQAARQNWIADQYNLAAVSSPTFTADRGYAGDGAASYLNTSFDPTTAPSPRFTLNSASLMVWQRVISGGSIRAIMGNTTASILLPGSGTSFGSKVNDAGVGVTDIATNKTGLFGSSRGGAAGFSRYRNGSLVEAVVQASTAVTNAAMRICSDGPGFSSGQVSIAAIGQDLDATQNLAAFNAINAYLTAVGA